MKLKKTTKKKISMFGWFTKNKNKTPETLVSCHIAPLRNVALLALIKRLKKNPTAHIFYYFEESKIHLLEILNHHNISFEEPLVFNMNPKAVQIYNAATFDSTLPIEERRFYCIDIFPLYSEFQELQKKLAIINPNAVLHVYIGFDEPIFTSFGMSLGRFGHLMFNEENLIESKGFSKNIEDTQKLIEKIHISNLPAKSSVEWFNKNLNSDFNSTTENNI